jgi:two-component system, response regulator
VWEAALIPPTEHRLILLVEDDTSDIYLTLHTLEKNHVKNNVVVVRDGVEALDYLFESGKYAGHTTILPEIVLLDLHLPKVGGMEVLGLIRAAERTRSLPVIILTSSADEQDRINNYGLATVGCIRKPVDFRNFLDAVLQCGGLHWVLVNEPSRGRRAVTRSLHTA